MTEIDWYELSASLDLYAALDQLGMEVVKERKGGVQLDFHCPLPDHPGSDRKPSFGLHSEELVWNCFTCDAGGSFPRLVEVLVEEVDGWEAALEWLLPFSDYEPDNLTDPDLMKFRDRVRKNLERAGKPVQLVLTPTLPIYPPSVLESLESATVPQLEKWGIKDRETIEHFGIKYDPRRDRHGYIGPALVVPHWFGGEIVGYQERWLSEDRPKHIPKWTNSNDFPRKETVFNYDTEGEMCIVVEAAFTAIRLSEVLESDIVPVATFGAQVTELQLKLLSRFKRICVAYDSDPLYRNASGYWVTGAGVRAKRKVAESLIHYMPVWIVPPTETDKGDLADESDDLIKSLVLQAEPHLK
jgi:hypothetical protein